MRRLTIAVLAATVVLAVAAPFAQAGTTLDIYFDNSLPGQSGSSVKLDRGYLNVYVSCKSTDTSVCRGTVTATKKGKTKKTTFEGTAGNAAGVGIKVKGTGTFKVCAKESNSGAKDCANIKVKG